MDLEKGLPAEPQPQPERQPWPARAPEAAAGPVRLTKSAPEPAPRAEGCLVVALRLPLRIVVLVLVVPVRIVWDALVVCGRFVFDRALRPLGRALAWFGRGIGAVLGFVGKALFVWPWVALWRFVLKPIGLGLLWLGHVLVVVPAVWVYRWVLTPVGHGLAWLGRVLVVEPARWLYARLLTPVGHGIAWLARGVWWVLRGIGLGIWWVVRGIGTAVGTLLRWIFVVPVVALWRWVLAPVGRAVVFVAGEIGDAFGHAWRIAGHISRAVWGFLCHLFKLMVVEPVRWVYRNLLTPVGHAVRDTLWRPVARGARAVGHVARQALGSVRESVREARADFRRMLFGTSREKAPVIEGPGARREPDTGRGRTLGSGTTPLTKD
ncbi:hypothetical protein [Streptomyces sp. NRRL B-1347]|uniref:hypothetical protein n=1 Tax=Streptomyces sp. NRRL B-1347 TaxID=1476877 RepID=UPI000A639ACE|nr:hypothetical protein [Streptomyces sp. NRRL B-1347]